MQNKLISSIKLLAPAAFIALLAGCASSSVSNITPADLPENPSQIYTLSARVLPKIATAIPDSEKAYIVIDGQTFAMKKSAYGQGLFEFDYHLPATRSELKYYFIGHYLVSIKGVASDRVEQTDLQRSYIRDRYVLSSDADRGHVGAKINILGRGFAPSDKVAFNGQPVETQYVSESHLSYFVPAIDPGKSYKVEIVSDDSKTPVGTFFIDSVGITVTPASLHIRSGDSQLISFAIPSSAGPGGIRLDITTDIPQSVIMPEVIIPARRSGVQVYISGGKPGKGNLYLRGYGTGEIVIPVTVE